MHCEWCNVMLPQRWRVFRAASSLMMVVALRRRGGRLLLARGSASAAVTLDASEHSGRSISRVPGIAVYLAEHAFGLPSGFVHMLQTVGIVHYTVIFLTVQQVLSSVLPSSPFSVNSVL